MPRLVLFLLAGALLLPNQLWAQCGGEERWAVKMGADIGVAQVDVGNPITTSIHDLVALVRPNLPSDDETRISAERIVRIVDGYLVKFKEETGKTGDSDYHLVISDNTMLYSPGGTSSQPSPHSFIAEIPDPNCVGGRHGQVTNPSRFQVQLAQVRTEFEQRFTSVKSGWNDANGIPVRLTGVVFFDRPHGQVGRALNGLELHPLLAIEFLGAAPSPTTTVALLNPGFEDGVQGWTASAEVITSNNQRPAHSGSWKAWLGGYGEVHTDKLLQEITLPASTGAISLTFFLNIDTEETNQQAYDKLYVRVRAANGQVLKILRTFSNQQVSQGFTLQSFDLTAWKGTTVKIEFEGKEDNGSSTSFVVDDVAITVGG